MDDNIKMLGNLENLMYGDKNGFEITLRMGRGIDEAKFNQICDVLVNLNNTWKKSVYIPKQFMKIFFEFKESCENSLTFYNEDKQLEILRSMDKITDLVNEIINN